MKKPLSKINQEFYDDLGETWNVGDDHPIALLRVEAEFRRPWILKSIERHAQGKSCRILDIGCGGGLLSNPLANTHHDIFAVDLSVPTLQVAARSDATARVAYAAMDAYQLAYADASMDVVCVLDVLEHLEDPKRCIDEISRVLRPGGLVLFYTFNRTWRSWLLAMKALDWIFPSGPRHIHLYRMFIKPKELESYLRQNGLDVIEWVGSKPNLSLSMILRLLITRRVPKNMSFRFCKSLAVGYYGIAKKTGDFKN